MTDWNLEAKKAVKYITEHLFEAHRGAFAKPNNVVIVFGNDGDDDRARREIEHVRNTLAQLEPAPQELAFAKCDEGYSWCLLFRAESERDAEKVAAGANLNVWVAWSEACGNPDGIDLFCGYQFGIAKRVIAEHLADDVTAEV